MGELRISRELIEEAMGSPVVRAALLARAKRIETAANSMAPADVEIWVEDGTRPKGRPFANVFSSDVDGEWGTAFTEQRRILGRAAQA